MNHEKLLYLKTKLTRKYPWYVKQIMRADEINAFSRDQLKILESVFARAEMQREMCSSWYPLDNHRIIRKRFGTEPEVIVEINDAGYARTVTGEYIKGTAARSVYLEYKDKLL